MGAARNRLLVVVLLLAGLVLIVAGLRALPRPQASPAEQCADSPVKPLCRALVRGPAVVPDLAELRDLPAPASPEAPPLAAGLAALRRGEPASAYRACGAAAELQGIEQAPALLCAGRAALALGWPARAAFLAGRALELEDDAAVHVLLALALEAQRDARGARLEYLRALDIEPDNGEALQGLHRVGGTAPPDLRGRRDRAEEEAGPVAVARLEVRHVQ